MGNDSGNTVMVVVLIMETFKGRKTLESLTNDSNGRRLVKNRLELEDWSKNPCNTNDQFQMQIRKLHRRSSHSRD